MRTTRSRSYWRRSWDSFRRDNSGLAFACVLAAMIFMALGAPVISERVTGYSPFAQDLRDPFASPNTHHLLGTDELGRDTLTRLIWGARVSLGVGFLSVGLFVSIGAAVGVIAGYFGGLVDEVLMRFVDALLSVPTIYLLIFITGLLPLPVGPWIVQRDAVSLAVIISVVAWGPVARLVRGQVLSVRSRDFILASRAVGASDLRLMIQHVMPNVLSVLIIAASLGLGQIILAEAALDFIGLGIQPPTPSWGNMLLAAQTYFFHSPLLVYVPGFAIALAVLASNLVGNAVRDAFDPSLS